jgi:hypothetical protein
MEESRLSPLFLAEFRRLREHIAKHVNVKTYRGQEIPGWAWCELGSRYIQALNDNKGFAYENHTATLLRSGLEKSLIEVRTRWKHVQHQWSLLIQEQRCCLDAALETLIVSLQSEMAKQFEVHLFGGQTRETKHAWKRFVEEMDCSTIQKANLDLIRGEIQNRFEQVIAMVKKDESCSWQQLQDHMRKSREEFLLQARQNAKLLAQRASLVDWKEEVSKEISKQCMKTHQMWLEEENQVWPQFATLMVRPLQLQLHAKEETLRQTLDREQRTQEEVKSKDILLKEREEQLYAVQNQKEQWEMQHREIATQRDLNLHEHQVLQDQLRLAEKNQEELEAKNQVLTAQSQRCQSLQESLDSISMRHTQDHASWSKEKDSLVEDVLKWRRKVTQKEQEVKKHEKQMAVNLEQLKLQENAVRSLQTQVEVKQKDCEAFQKQLEGKVEKCSELTMDCQNVKKKNETLYKDNQELNREVQKLLSQLRAMEKTNHDYQTALDKKGQVEKFKNELEAQLKNKGSELAAKEIALNNSIAEGKAWQRELNTTLLALEKSNERVKHLELARDRQMREEIEE